MEMKGKWALKAVLLSAVLALPLAGCQKKHQMSQAQVQYLSHMDQAHFFQKQGELRASTQEARSAIKLEPGDAAPYLLIVDNLLIAGDAASARTEIAQIRQHLSQKIPPSVHNSLVIDSARADLLSRNYDDALAQLKKVKKGEKTDDKQIAQRDNLQGKILLAKGDLKGASQAFEAASKADSTAPAGLVGLSKVAYRQGDKAKAAKLLDQAMKLDKDDSETWLWKAQLAQKEKRYGDAENAYMKALDGIGKYDIMTYEKYQTMSSLIQVLRAQNKIQEAYVYEEILAKSAPGAIKSDFEAATKAYKEGNLDEAAQHLEAILKRAPGNQRSAMLLGMILFQQGKTQEAQKILAPLEKSTDSLEIGKLLAATQIRMGQSQQAQKMLKQLKGGDKDPGVLAMVGIAALGTGQPEVGRKYIEKSLALKPDNPSLRLRYANWLMSQKDYRAAAEQGRLAIKHHPDLVPARRLEVEAYLQDKAPEKAFDAVKAWQRDQPKSVAAVITHGDLEVSQDHLAKARQEYERAARMAPKMANPQFALGNLARREGKDAQALAHYKKAVELAPDDRNALRALLQLSTQNEKRLDETVAFLKKQADQHPKAIGPRIVLLQNALREGNFKDAEALANRIQGLSKRREVTEHLMTAIYSNAALSALRNKQDQQAAQIIKQAEQQYPDNLQIGLVDAHRLFTVGKEQQALDALRKLKKNHPDSDRPYLVEADYRAGKKQYDQAIDLYKLALQKSDDPQISVQLAHVQNEAGQGDKALATLEKAAKLYPDAPGVILQLGLAYQSQKQTDKAVQTYQRLLKLSPDQPVALNNLAWLYQQKGDKRAINMAKRAYELQPRSAAIADTYGWIMYSQGQVKDSIPILEKAHKLAPKMKDIALHLAQAYRKVGLDAKAKSVLQAM